MKEIKEILIKFGFSDKEVALYLTLLTLGPSVVSKIAKAGKLNRSTCYVILESLTERGLVSITEREKGVKIFTAVPAEKLADHLAGIAKKYAELASSAKKLVPELKKKTEKKSEDSPKVRLFEGSEGVRTVYEDALSSLETIRAYASKEADQEMFGEYYKKLQKKGIKVNVLMPQSKGKNQKEFSPEISVYDNKISLVSPAENFALIIESPELAQTLKRAFDESWQKEKGKRSFFGKEALGGAS